MPKNISLIQNTFFQAKWGTWRNSWRSWSGSQTWHHTPWIWGQLQMTVQTWCQLFQVRQEEGEGGERYFVNMFTGLAWYILPPFVVFHAFLKFSFIVFGRCILFIISLFYLVHFHQNLTPSFQVHCKGSKWPCVLLWGKWKRVLLEPSERGPFHSSERSFSCFCTSS